MSRTTAVGSPAAADVVAAVVAAVVTVVVVDAGGLQAAARAAKAAIAAVRKNDMTVFPKNVSVFAALPRRLAQVREASEASQKRAQKRGFATALSPRRRIATGLLRSFFGQKIAPCESVEARIEPVRDDEFGVAALLDDAALLEHQDAVGFAHSVRAGGR